MVNRYFNRTPYQGELYMPPLQAIQQGLEMAQKRYDFNAAVVDQLQNKYIDALEPDRARANELQERYNAKIDEAIKATGNDLSKLDLYSLKRDIKKDFKPGTEGYAIAQNKAIFDAADKEARERVKSGKVLDSDYLKWKNLTKSSYKGATQDPITKEYQGIPSVDLPDYYDVTGSYKEAIAQLKPERYQVGDWEIKNGWLRTPEEREGISAQRYLGTMRGSLYGDAKAQSYIQAQAKLNGTSYTQELARFDMEAQLRAANLAFDSLHKASDFKPDEYSILKAKFANDIMLENLESRNDMNEAVFKNSLDNPTPIPQTRMFNYGPANTGLSNPKPVEFNPDGSVFKKSSTSGWNNGVYTPSYSRDGGPSTSQRDDKYTTVSTNDLLTSPAKAAAVGIDYVTLKGVQAANKDLKGKELIEAYNKTVSSTTYDVAIPNGMGIPTYNQSYALTERIFANPSAYSAKLITPDGTKQVSLSDYISELRDDKGKPKVLVGGAMLPESGIAAGWSIDMGKDGTLVLDPPNNLKPMLNNITKSTQKAMSTGVGDPISIYGGPTVIPKARFDADSGRKTLEYYYASNPNEIVLQTAFADPTTGKPPAGAQPIPLSVEDFQEIVTKPMFTEQIPVPIQKGSWQNQGNQ